MVVAPHGPHFWHLVDDLPLDRQTKAKPSIMTAETYYLDRDTGI
jgi:hypothetical protein